MYAVTGEDPPAELIEYAEIVITVCIMSIVITAPVGAIVITIAGPRLLSKTTKPPVLEGELPYIIEMILSQHFTVCSEHTFFAYI